jgi:hypothetical protein
LNSIGAGAAFTLLNTKPNNMTNRRRRILPIILILSILNYSRIKGSENIRTVQFISIFVMGALTALVIRELADWYRERNSQKTDL